LILRPSLCADRPVGHAAAAFRPLPARGRSSPTPTRRSPSPAAELSGEGGGRTTVTHPPPPLPSHHPPTKFYNFSLAALPPPLPRPRTPRRGLPATHFPLDTHRGTW